MAKKSKKRMWRERLRVRAAAERRRSWQSDREWDTGYHLGVAHGLELAMEEKKKK